MSNEEYPIEPEVAVALLRLERKILERLTRLEGKVDSITRTTGLTGPSSGATRSAVVGAAGAGLGLGLVEGLRRLFS